MRHCYLCDDAISGQAFRRSVGTGRSQRVTFARRVSASSTQRSGLRTLCGACAARVDSAARLQAKVGGAVAVAFVGIVIYANLASKSAPEHTVEPAGLSGVAPATTAAPPVQTQPTPASGEGPQLRAVSPLVPAAQAITSPILHTAPVPPASPPLSLPSWTSAAAVPWRHKTARGTRWSLRVLPGNRFALLVDLGDDQVATVLVAPEFQKLDLQGAEQRIEFIKLQVAGINKRSAAYAFYRNGMIMPYP